MEIGASIIYNAVNPRTTRLMQTNTRKQGDTQATHIVNSKVMISVRHFCYLPLECVVRLT